MKQLKLLTVVVLAAAIAGGAIRFGVPLLFPYRHLRGQTAPVYVHPLVKQIDAARALRAAGRPVEAQTLLRQQIRLYPNAAEAQAARDLLGEINTEMFFSRESLFGKSEYTVQRGDSLWRIARKLDSTPASIMRASNLESSLLRPGDQLLVPDNDFTLTLDLPNERLVVHHGDGFFKEYPVVDVHLLPRVRQALVVTKVTATTFWKEGGRVSSDAEQEKATADPRIHLGRGGYILYGIDEDASVAPETVELAERPEEASRNPEIPPRGIALLTADLAELQLLIRRGTPVTIVRAKP